MNRLQGVLPQKKTLTQQLNQRRRSPRARAVHTPLCRNISVLVIMGTVSCLVWLPRFGYMQGCRPGRFRTFDTGFICASAIRYYITSPILDVDMEQARREFHFPSLLSRSGKEANGRPPIYRSSYSTTCASWVFQMTALRYAGAAKSFAAACNGVSQPPVACTGILQVNAKWAFS
jgi:hypothetical protein